MMLNQSDIKRNSFTKEKTMFSSQVLMQAKLEQIQQRIDKSKLPTGSAVFEQLEKIISQNSKESVETG